MKLEDLTKEELIYIIHKRFGLREFDFDFDVLMARSQACQKKSFEAGNKAAKTFSECMKLVEPYDGKPVSVIPLATIVEAEKTFKTYKKFLREEEKYREQDKELQKQIDEILARG